MPTLDLPFKINKVSILISDIILYIQNNQFKLKKTYEGNVGELFYSLLDDLDLFWIKKNYIEDLGGKEIIPIFEAYGSDIMIGIHNGRYCDFDTQMIEATIEYYDTPEEVWEKVIKPDIEAYYETQIEE